MGLNKRLQVTDSTGVDGVQAKPTQFMPIALNGNGDRVLASSPTASFATALPAQVKLIDLYMPESGSRFQQIGQRRSFCNHHQAVW